MEITEKIIETKEAEETTQFNLKGLATGVYFAKVRTEKETVIFRVLVN